MPGTSFLPRVLPVRCVGHVWGAAMNAEGDGSPIETDDVETDSVKVVHPPRNVSRTTSSKGGRQLIVPSCRISVDCDIARTGLI